MAQESNGMREEFLEELYNLLELYFQAETSLKVGPINGHGGTSLIEKTLDAVILREELLARITRLIMQQDFYKRSKGELK